MRLENILALTDGKIINDPFVKIFTNIVFDANKIRSGDLFIACDEDKIEEAVFNGAYGVLFDKPTQISDKEIAWIKVQNINDALKKLLRFRLIEKNVIVYKSDEITLKLALQIMYEPKFMTVNGDIKSITNRLWNIEEHSILMFCPALVPKELFTNIKSIPKTKINSITIIEKTLFETSFIYDDVFYERQSLSPLFIPYLEELLSLFKTLKINIRIKKFTPIEHFEALFINKKFEIKEFGTSNIVLIFEKEFSIVKKEILFLQEQANWAKTIFVVPSKHSNNFDNIENLIIYSDENEIINILKKWSFHFALIVGADKSILSKPINNQTQLSLFD